MAKLVGPAARIAAYERLRELVLTDPEVQGTFLTEATLVERLGLSRTPIREALIMLAADEFVELIPHRGAYVPPTTAKNVRDTFAMRSLIEEHCARTTIAADTVPRAAMRSLLAEQEALDIATANRKEFISIDQAFHAALVNAADNAVMSQMYHKLRVTHMRFGISAAMNVGRFQEVLREHHAIFDALDAGDADAAVAAIREHITITRDILLSQLDRGKSFPW